MKALFKIKILPGGIIDDDNISFQNKFVYCKIPILPNMILQQA